MTVNLFQPDGAPVTRRPEHGRRARRLDGRAGRAAGRQPPAAARSPASSARTPTRAEPWDVTVAADAPPTEPYWLRTPRTGPRLRPGPASRRRCRRVPFEPPLLVARVPLTIGGAAVTVERPVEYRYADAVRGEIRRDVQIVPAVTVAFDEPLAHRRRRAAAAQPRTVRVRVQSETLASGPGVVRIVAAGRLAGDAGGRADRLRVARRRRVGAVHRHAAARASRRAPTRSPRRSRSPAAPSTRRCRSIDYPHIQKHRLYAPAQMTARVLDLAVAPVKVGYVMGSGDRVPEAIRRMGLDVTLLDEDDARRRRPLALRHHRRRRARVREPAGVRRRPTPGCCSSCATAAR